MGRIGLNPGMVLVMLLLELTVVLLLFLSQAEGKDYSYINKPSYNKLKKEQKPVYELGQAGVIIIGAVVGGTVFFGLILGVVLFCVFRRHGYCQCQSRTDNRNTDQCHKSRTDNRNTDQRHKLTTEEIEAKYGRIVKYTPSSDTNTNKAPKEDLKEKQVAVVKYPLT